MRIILPILAFSTLTFAGCELIVRDQTPPGQAKHADGPGHSESAPGQQKKH
jgi:hypothetical protein